MGIMVFLLFLNFIFLFIEKKEDPGTQPFTLFVISRKKFAIQEEQKMILLDLYRRGMTGSGTEEKKKLVEEAVLLTKLKRDQVTVN